MLLPAKTVAPLDAPLVPHRALFEAAAQRDVTLFVAPVGYLMPESLATVLRARHSPTLWLSLSADDHDPAMLLLALATAASRLKPELLAAAGELLRRPPDPRHGRRPAFAALAAAVAEALPADCVVVLEHVDALEGSPGLALLVEALLPALASRYPCILIASREPRGVALPPQALRHSAAALRLTAGDLGRLADGAGLSLPDGLLRRLLSLLGGQADSLYSLFRIAAQLGPAPTTRLVAQAASADDLLARSARVRLGAEEDGASQALALSARLGCVHPELAAAMRIDGAPDEAWLLPLSDGWARLRDVWRSTLPRAVRSGDAAPIPALERAAEFFARRGILSAAVPLYLDLGAFNRAAELLSGSLNTLMGEGYHLTLQRWVARLPAPVLHDWPWLQYAQGEMAATQRETGRARRSFAAAAAGFETRDDPAGVCQSLLAESTLYAWDGDIEQASTRTLSAIERAERSGLTWHLGWAAWQLVGLAQTEDDRGLAMVHLDRALSAAGLAGEHALAAVLRPVEELLVRQRSLGEEREHYRQAYLAAEQAAEEAGERLRQLVHTPAPGALPAQPWAATPLMLRLAAPEPAAPEAAPAGGPRFWRQMARALGMRREAVGQRPAPPEPAAGPGLEPGPAQLAPLQPAEAPGPALVAIAAPAAAVGGRAAAVPDCDVVGPAHGPAPEAAGPALTAHVLGTFRISLNDCPIESWPSGRGRSLLKYLLLSREAPAPRDVLIDLFWPEAGPEDGRNNLNVAMHGLRQALRAATDLPVVEYRRGDASYRLNPELQIWLDVDEFERALKAGRQHEAAGRIALAVTHYEQAASLYQGDLMADDPYDEWPVLRREQLRLAHLDLLERLGQIYFSQGQYGACASLCQQIVARDSCREDAHCRLMRCYTRQGQHHLALRQYQACVKALTDDIGVEPLPSTTLLAERIRRREYV